MQSQILMIITDNRYPFQQPKISNLAQCINNNRDNSIRTSDRNLNPLNNNPQQSSISKHRQNITVKKLINITSMNKNITLAKAHFLRNLRNKHLVRLQKILQQSDNNNQYLHLIFEHINLSIFDYLKSKHNQKISTDNIHKQQQQQKQQKQQQMLDLVYLSIKEQIIKFIQYLNNIGVKIEIILERIGIHAQTMNIKYYIGMDFQWEREMKDEVGEELEEFYKEELRKFQVDLGELRAKICLDMKEKQQIEQNNNLQYDKISLNKQNVQKREKACEKITINNQRGMKLESSIEKCKKLIKNIRQISPSDHNQSSQFQKVILQQKINKSNYFKSLQLNFRKQHHKLNRNSLMSNIQSLKNNRINNLQDLMNRLSQKKQSKSQSKQKQKNVIKINKKQCLNDFLSVLQNPDSKIYDLQKKQLRCNNFLRHISPSYTDSKPDNTSPQSDKTQPSNKQFSEYERLIYKYYNKEQKSNGKQKQRIRSITTCPNTTHKLNNNNISLRNYGSNTSIKVSSQKSKEKRSYSNEDIQIKARSAITNSMKIISEFKQKYG